MAISPNEARGATALIALGALAVYVELGNPGVLLVPVIVAILFIARSDAD